MVIKLKDIQQKVCHLLSVIRHLSRAAPAVALAKAGHLFFLLPLLTLSFSLYSQQRLYPNEFPLSDVTLLDGPFLRARDLNAKVILQYDADRLLAGYRKEAGLPAKAKSFSNWDGLDGREAGHYLSALSMNAATGNAECKKRMAYVIAELKACQEANGKLYPEWGVGYVGAVPDGKNLWPKLMEGDVAIVNKYWVPWYNVHKMFAGLRDAWVYTSNNDAKIMFLAFCDWAVNLTSALSDEQMQTMLAQEHGGMNEVLADAFQISGNTKYLDAARRFSHKDLLDPMAAGRDNLDNKHANTQVPKAIGFERIGELSGDAKFTDAGNFFWNTVVSNRTLAFGGNSRREFFPGVQSYHEFIEDVQGPESCNSNNMLKLTEDLFRIHPDAAYADYYERTVLNHILSTQHPVHGGFVYFTPVRPQSYRVYSAPNQAMWCCVGTGMENHSKYNQFIYTHAHDSLYLNLFIASELNWKEKNLRLKQETAFPYQESTQLSVTSGSGIFTLMVRCPSWVSNADFKISINGKPVAINAQPSSYVAIKRQWKKGDKVQVFLPMHNTAVPLPNVPSYIAFMHGPVLLGAKTGSQDMRGLIADSGRWAHIPSGDTLALSIAPVLITPDASQLAASLLPIPGKPLHFRFPPATILNGPSIPFELEPFYQIHDSRYMMYWRVKGGRRTDDGR